MRSSPGFWRRSALWSNLMWKCSVVRRRDRRGRGRESTSHMIISIGKTMFDRNIRPGSRAGFGQGSYLVALALWFLLAAAACVPGKGLAAAAVDADTAQRLQAIIDHSRDDGLPGGIIVRMESLR